MPELRHCLIPLLSVMLFTQRDNASVDTSYIAGIGLYHIWQCNLRQRLLRMSPILILQTILTTIALHH